MPSGEWELGSPIAFRKQFARITKDALAALFLSECFYWSERHEAEGGWFYKTASEWEEETALTRRQQEHARTVLLGLGLIEARRTGKNGTMHYRIVEEALRKAIQECTDRTNQQLGMAETYKPECTDRTNRNVRIVQTPICNKPSTSLQQERESTPVPRVPPVEKFVDFVISIGGTKTQAEKCYWHYEANGWPSVGGSVRWDALAKKWLAGDANSAMSSVPYRNGTGPPPAPPPRDMTKDDPEIERIKAREALFKNRPSVQEQGI